MGNAVEILQSFGFALVFPEINYDRVDAIRGMDIVFVTTATTDAEAKALLRGFDLPFAS